MKGIIDKTKPRAVKNTQDSYSSKGDPFKNAQYSLTKERPTVIFEMQNVEPHRDKHLALAQNLEEANDNMICVLFKKASQGELDFNAHEKVVLLNTLKYLKKCLFRAISYTRHSHKYAVYLQEQEMSALGEDIRSGLAHIYEKLSDTRKTFTFLDCRGRCKMTREQHYKAALKGGVAFAQLK